MKQDKQPRRASKDVSIDKLHPASDMGKRAKGGDKFASAHGLPPKQKESSGPQTTRGKKTSRP
jgi:hypothetical protein